MITYIIKFFLFLSIGFVFLFLKSDLDNIEDIVITPCLLSFDKYVLNNPSSTTCSLIGLKYNQSKAICETPTSTFCDNYGWHFENKNKYCVDKNICRYRGAVYDKAKRTCVQPDPKTCTKRLQRFDEEQKICVNICSPSKPVCEYFGLNFDKSKSTCIQKVAKNPKTEKEPSYERGGEIQNRIDLFYDLYTIINIDVSMGEDNWKSLREQLPRGGLCNWENQGYKHYPWYKAKIGISFTRGDTVTDIELSDVGIRKKSWCWSHDTQRPSLKISIDKYNASNKSKATSLIGVTDLVLNNSKQDLSYIRQCLIYKLLRNYGVPAPRCNFANVTIDDKPYGIYINVEPIKKPLLTYWFESSKGDLNEIEGKDLVETFINYELRKKGNQFSAKKKGDYLNGIEKWVDINSYLDFWAMETVLHHWDSYSYNINNSYIYRNPKNNRFHLIAWGADQTMQGDWLDNNDDFNVSVISKVLYNDPKYRNMYCSRIAAVKEKIKNIDIDSIINKLSDLVIPYHVSRDMDRFFGQEELTHPSHGWDLRVQEVKNQILLVREIFRNNQYSIEEDILDAKCNKDSNSEETSENVEELVVSGKPEVIRNWGIATSVKEATKGWEIIFRGLGDGNKSVGGWDRRNSAMYKIYFNNKMKWRDEDSIMFDIRVPESENYKTQELRKETYLVASIAVKYGVYYQQWLESREVWLKKGWNKVKIRFNRNSWKDGITNWQYGNNFYLIRNIRSMILKIANKDLSNQNIDGSLLINNFRIKHFNRKER